MPPLRPLRALVTGLLALGTLAALELGVRAFYEPPAPMRDKAQAYEALPHQGPELLIFGTCLPEQIIQTQALGEQLGAPVYNLATPAGTSRLFYLTLLHHVPVDAQVQAIVVPYGEGDLIKLMTPYESQVMQLAQWSDMPDLIEWGCEDSACAAEMTVRKASAAYQYRGYLANRFWQGIGLKEPIPGYVLSPGAVEPPRDLPDHEQQPLDGVRPPEPEPGIPGPQPGEFNPQELRAGADAEYVYLVQFLALAQQRGIPVLFVPLPQRSQIERRSQQGHRPPMHDPQLVEVVRGAGAELLDLNHLPGLQVQHFEDEVHLNTEGRVLVTQAIGQTLQQRLRTGSR